MKYVPFGKTGLQVSRLGFGCMRFPSRLEDGKKVFDEEESIRMLRRALELGVNYFDSAPGYCDTLSESILGKAMAGNRDKVLLSTKNSIKSASGDEYDKQLETSLRRLQTDHIDFYHFWGIGLEKFNDMVMAPGGPMERARHWQEQGVIRNISFSFHDSPGNMSEIIRRGEGVFASVLCQYNLLDRALEEDIAFAREQGLGVVIMGPVGGGRLGAPTPVIQRLLPGEVHSSAAVALRFVLSNQNLHIALSGMSSMEMLEENAQIASNSEPLSAEEITRVNDTMRENAKLAELYCTGCNYCMPCPKGVNIPEIFTLMNYHRIYKITDYARERYGRIGKSSTSKYENAAACVNCGICETKCPQKLKIREQLRQTHEALAL